MVKLTEVEDEHFAEKPRPAKNNALLADEDDDEYTDTGMKPPSSLDPISDAVIRRPEGIQSRRFNITHHPNLRSCHAQDPH